MFQLIINATKNYITFYVFGFVIGINNFKKLHRLGCIASMIFVYLSYF